MKKTTKTILIGLTTAGAFALGYYFKDIKAFYTRIYISQKIQRAYEEAILPSSSIDDKLLDNSLQTLEEIDREDAFTDPYSRAFIEYFRKPFAEMFWGYDKPENETKKGTKKEIIEN